MNSSARHRERSRTYRRLSLLSALCLATLATTAARAQWVDREIPVRAGWNAIWLDVEPAVREPAAFLAGVDYESLWTRLAPAAPNDSERWLRHLRDGPAFLDTLRSVQGPGGYLLLARSAGTIRVRGRPVNVDARLAAGRHELVGATVDALEPPGFDEHFVGLENVIVSIYGLQGGEYRELSAGRLEAGTAYWVFANASVTARSALDVDSPPDGLRFGADGATRDLAIEVPVSTRPKLLLARTLPSEAPPDGSPPDAAGSAAWLELRHDDGSFRSLDEGEFLQVEVPPGEARVPLGIRAVVPRAAKDGGGAGLPCAGAIDSPFQAVLELTDGDGNQSLVGAVLQTEPIDGVWVGRVELTRVSRHSRLGTPDLVPAPALGFNLLAEIEGARVTLLDEVARRTRRDGQELDYRVTALLFPEPLELAGDFDPCLESSTVAATMALSRDHPVNPYRHRFQPEHREGYDIERSIEMTFTREASGAEPLVDEAGGLKGTYTEVISGLSLEPITVEGSFRLRRLGDADAP